MRGWVKKFPRGGYALLVSMGLLGLLAALGSAFVGLTRAEQATSTCYVDQVRSRMIAQAGIDVAISGLTAIDRVAPWSGQYAHVDGVTGAVYNDQGAGVAFPAGLQDGGFDRWFYGERYKAPGAVVSPTTRVYGRSTREPGEADLVSFHAGTVTTPGGTYGYSGIAPGNSGFAGTYVGNAQNPGDFFMLRVMDSASMINVNDTNTGSRLQTILDYLGEELTPPIPTLGTRILTERAADGRYLDKADLRARVFSASADEWERARDFVTTHMWQDASVVRYPFPHGAPANSAAFLEADENGDGAPDGRSPVNINTAPREVLVSLIRGLAATWWDRTAGGLVRKTVEIPAANVVLARQVADWIITTRYWYFGDPRYPTAYPHVDWMHVGQDCFDTMNGTGAAPALTPEQRDLLKANFGPNTDCKKFNPDLLFVDPDRSGRTDFSYLDKTDLTYGSTETCYGSMGYYEITSVGRVLDAAGNRMGETAITAVAKTYDILRLTTQADFETDRVFDDTMELSAEMGGARIPAVATLPEYPHRRVDGTSAAWAAKYDGQLTLNGIVNHRGTPKSFLAGFVNAVAAGDPPMRRLDGFNPPGANVAQLGTGVNPAGGLFPNATYPMAGKLGGSMLYPFGAHIDTQRRDQPDFLQYDPTHLSKTVGTVEFWYKPEVDLVGTSGWESQIVWLMDFAGSSNYDAVRVRVQNRRLQVAFYLAPDYGGGGGIDPIFDFGDKGLFDFMPFASFGPPPPVGKPAAPVPAPKPGPKPGPGGGGGRAGAGYVTLTADLTLHQDTIDPRTWNPHTWHHIEVTWKDLDAKLFIDGEQMDQKALPVAFEPNEDQGTFFGSGSTAPRWYFGAYTRSDHDSEPSFDSKVVGTYDNICSHPKRLHDASFPPRSRYHDVMFSGYTTTPGAGDTDVNGHFGLYQRRLRPIEQAAARGGVTVLTLSCTHWHPPHEHSSGDHSGMPPARGLVGLGHVTLGLKTQSTNYVFDYDNCAGTPCRTNVGGVPQWIKFGPTDQVTLLTKLELAENSQIPHNDAPIVDDVTITYTTGVKFLTWKMEL